MIEIKKIIKKRMNEWEKKIYIYIGFGIYDDLTEQKKIIIQKETYINIQRNK